MKTFRTLLFALIFCYATTVVLAQNFITDSTFDGITDTGSMLDDDVAISVNWRVKTKDSDGYIKAIATKEDGLRIDALYDGFGYLYVRQSIPDVMQFSDKVLTLEVEINRASWQDLKYDVYIQASMDADGSERVLVVDTESIPLSRGSNTIELPIYVPDLSGYTAYAGSNLQVAVRFIGEDQNTMFYVNSIKLTDSDSATTITAEQYEAICLKIKELVE